MEFTEWLKAIGSVNNMWSVAAFAIAAVLGLVNLYLRSASGAQAKDKGEVTGSAPTATLLWVGAGVICLMGLAPIAANGYLETQRMKTSSVYHVRVVALDSGDVPVSDAHVRTSVSSETAMTSDGEGAITIARGSLPANGEVTIFVDKDSAFLHGRQAIKLADDMNPSVSVRLAGDRSATVSGMVEDNDGHALEGATISLPGGSSTSTSKTGNFTLEAHASAGQPVTVHVEKQGYQPTDQSQLAGTEPAVIVLKHDR